jgi:aspartyl-tRNA(Asn)/glutamyl-tRNA(Gln) amidotransferase subunit A
MNKTIRELAADLAAGRITSVELTQRMLARAEAHRGAGRPRLCQPRWRTGAGRSACQRRGARRRSGAVALAGIPLSIKDLFDVKGK